MLVSFSYWVIGYTGEGDSGPVDMSFNSLFQLLGNWLYW